MLGDDIKLIIPLIILLLILIGLVLFAVLYIRGTVQKTINAINTEYNNYKNELKNQNESLTKQLLKQLSEYNEKNAAGKNTNTDKDLMNIFCKLSKSIKENCVNTMNQIGASRIAIYLFHNGVHSTHGINFFKLSCICEKVAIGSGIKERMMEHNNIPINLFDDMIDKLVAFNKYTIINNDEIQNTNHKIFISADKIKYTQLVALYDVNNNMLGFVAIEMDKEYFKDEVDKETEILNDLAKQLVPILSYSDYVSIKTQ